MLADKCQACGAATTMCEQPLLSLQEDYSVLNCFLSENRISVSIALSLEIQLFQEIGNGNNICSE